VGKTPERHMRQPSQLLFDPRDDVRVPIAVRRCPPRSQSIYEHAPVGEEKATSIACHNG
jgi:hypothetical protein